MDDLLPLREADFRWVAALLYDRFGIKLGEQKRILVAGRLQKRVRQLGLAGFAEYFAFLRADSSGTELVELVNRLTTNHSFFYREKEHFEFLVKEILPGIARDYAKIANYPLRIWSAGCAAGEEAFTIAIMLRENLGRYLPAADAGILASDISIQVLTEAKAATYSSQRLRELPPVYRSNYFAKVGEDAYEVIPAVRSLVLFKRLNLMSEKFPFKGAFDVVFCRNVMIYFDQDVRKRLVRSIYSVLKPGGYLFIGHSESLQRDDCPLDYIKPAIYRKGCA